MSATKLRNGVLQVAEAGKPQPLTDEASAHSTVTSVTVQALGTNEGTVVVGGKNVVAGPGTHAAPTQSGVALTAGQMIKLDVIDVTDVFVDVTKNKDGVSWVAPAVS